MLHYRSIYYKISLIPLITLFLLSILQASSIGKKVSNIIIIGNETTDSEIILRELHFEIGDSLSEENVIDSRNRILNLQLFNRVEFSLLPDQNDVMLLIEVTERLYLFPYPQVKLEDRDWNKITYGFGMIHQNFRGRNEKVSLNVLFGNRPGYNVSYFNPWLAGEAHLSLGLYFKQYLMNNRALEFEENHLDSEILIGKHWTRDFYNLVNFIRTDITVPEAYAGVMPSGNRRTISYALKLSTIYDKRDIYAYPTQGIYLHTWVTKNGLFNKNLDYWKYQFDIRKYHNWMGLIFATRIFTLQSIGTLPIYDRTYIGFGERIRGHFYSVYEGRHSFIGSMELRFPILPLKYFTFNTGQVPEYLTRNLKFGINGGIFFDTGMVWDRRDEFNINHFKNGFGVGLHFLLPYVEVFRAEAGFNENFDVQYIFEVKTAF